MKIGTRCREIYPNRSARDFILEHLKQKLGVTAHNQPLVNAEVLYDELHTAPAEEAVWEVIAA